VGIVSRVAWAPIVFDASRSHTPDGHFRGSYRVVDSSCLFLVIRLAPLVSSGSPIIPAILAIIVKVRLDCLIPLNSYFRIFKRVSIPRGGLRFIAGPDHLSTQYKNTRYTLEGLKYVMRKWNRSTIFVRCRSTPKKQMCGPRRGEISHEFGPHPYQVEQLRVCKISNWMGENFENWQGRLWSESSAAFPLVRYQEPVLRITKMAPVDRSGMFFATFCPVYRTVISCGLYQICNCIKS
jgi:hypothetical protein